MDEHQRRKLAVILHADIVGSTTLVQQDEAIAHDRIRDSFRRFSETIKIYGGSTHELRGDALVAEFARASDAVCAALRFQHVQTELLLTISDAIKPMVRIGISLGEVIIADNTITGAGVVLAQRLEQLATGGGVVVQGSVSETVPARLPFDFENMGEQTLKGFERPVTAFVVRLKPGEQLPEPESNAVVTTAGDAEAPSPLELPDRPSIAVLPFVNMSSDPEQEYFSDGITEDIITDLSKVSSLFVIARNSSFAFKNKAFKIPDVCREFGVRFALEGSIRKAGNRIRVTAQLLDGLTGDNLWAERYDRDITDIFEVQDDLTRQIVSALKVNLSAAERARIAGSGTKNVDAHDLFLRGREFLLGTEKNREGFDRATGNFRRAIELDPAYPGPYAALAMLFVLDYQNRWSDTPDASLDQARSLVQKAIARDEKNPFSHYVAAVVAAFSKDHDRWANEADRALALNPNYPIALNARGMVYIYTGEPEKGIPYMERAIRMDPAFQQQYLHFLGTAYFVAGNYQTAASLFKERISLNPGTDLSRAFLASTLGHLDNPSEARRIWDELKQINPEYSHVDHIGRLPFKYPDDAEKFIEGLRKAGVVE